MGQYARAQEDYANSIALRPDNLDAFERRARSFAALKDFAGAAADYTTILDVQIGNTDARLGRGKALFVLGRFEEALADFEIAVLDSGQSTAIRIFVALWKYLAAERVGRDGNAALRSDMEKIDKAANRFASVPIDVFQDVWPGPVAALYLGEVAPDDIRQTPREAGGQSRDERAAEVTFYLGEYYLVRGSDDRARHLFEETLATGVTHYVEYDFARSELGRLGD